MKRDFLHPDFNEDKFREDYGLSNQRLDEYQAVVDVAPVAGYNALE